MCLLMLFVICFLYIFHAQATVSLSFAEEPKKTKKQARTTEPLPVIEVMSLFTSVLPPTCVAINNILVAGSGLALGPYTV